MSHKLFISCLFFIITLWSSPPCSAEVRSLYEARSVIADQSSSAQRNARRSAFREVLVKVSGDRAILRSSAIRSAVTRANDYLLSYRYESQQNELFYIADFDRTRVDNLIRQNGFAIWGARRPETILWFAVQQKDQHDRELVSETSDTIATADAISLAKRRGIEISFPLMDLTDIQQVSVFDVWGGFTDNILLASQRYGVDIVYSARIYFMDGEDLEETETPLVRRHGWFGDWTLIDGEKTLSGNVLGKSVDDVTESLVHQLADILGQTYAIKVTDSASALQSVTIEITNIDSLAKYEDVRLFLSGLSVVSSARLVSQQQALATFELELLGTEEDLQNVFRLDDNINVVKDQFGFAVSEHKYIWNR